ncbi:hypothetical protein BGZ60DRAFT_401827 [Tricladium varicosporioides]|nr:hypothetical protein BGZ60DRAFT_401827 [Hymenoscyphus varicosporioides]
MPSNNNNYCFVVKRSDHIIRRDSEDENPNRETILGKFSSLTQAISCAELTVTNLHRQRGTKPIGESEMLYFGKTVWIHDSGEDPVDYAYITVEKVMRQGSPGVDDGRDSNGSGNEAIGGADDDHDDDWVYVESDWNMNRPDNSNTSNIIPAATASSRSQSETMPASKTTAQSRPVETPRRVSDTPVSLQTSQSTQPSQPIQTISIPPPEPRPVLANTISNEAMTRIFSQPILPGRATLPIPRRNLFTRAQTRQVVNAQPRPMLNPSSRHRSHLATAPATSSSTSTSVPPREPCATAATKRNRSMVDDGEEDGKESQQAAPKKRRLLNFMDLVALSRAGMLKYLGRESGVVMRSLDRED